MASGKAKTSKVHLLSHLDDMQDMVVSCFCGTKLRRNFASVEVAHRFQTGDRKPCPKCLPHFSQDLLDLLF